MARAWIGVGSNIEPAENVSRALRRLAEAVPVLAVSTVYQTRPEGRPGDPPFYNGVVAVETDLGPREIKYQVLRRIERELGRVRGSDRFAPRTIDLDLLLYDDLVLREPGLVLPDPTIQRRAFWALALAELAPGLVLPGVGRPVAEVAAALPPGGAQPLDAFTERLRREVEHGNQRRKDRETGSRASV